jgi:aspartyl-tRNA(Asn)/glutamyl-tRNA(Gln) amidotransferase subunit A
MHHKTLMELSKLLTSGECSSVELTQHFIKRINQFNPDLNCFITTGFDQALAQAAAADKHRQQKDSALPPLLGLPIALKDIFCTQDMPTTCASKMLATFTPPYQATVVDALQRAGGVMLGKTNMDEFAMGSSNENSYFGPCHNPWDLTCVPGGSSGGSACAVASRLAPAALGTDTGGSIRQPAALCGITGLKPTYGRVSRYGMVAFASSLDQCGPMAASAEDLALLLNTLAGADPRDETASTQAVPDYLANLGTPLSGRCIGLPKQWFNDTLSTDNAAHLDAAMAQLKSQGVTFKEVDLPHQDLSLPVYYILAPSECSSNLARYDGIHYGYRADNPTSLDDLYKRSRSEGFGDEVKRRILIGTFALSSGYYDAYYGKAQKIRQLIRQDFHQAFEQVDAILGPTTPTTAFKLGEKNQDPISMYLSDSYTISANLAGLPALSLPIGHTHGLPVGMQLIGKAFDEASLLQIAHQYQCITDVHRQCPDDYQ